MDRYRAILLAYGPAAPAALRSLCSHLDVVGLVVPPGADVYNCAVLAEPLAEHIPRCTCPNPKEIIDVVRRVRPDVLVICSYDRILPDSAIAHAPVVNVHYAPLPRYRGRATVNWAILNGLDRFAVTIHEVVSGLDAGPILLQVPCEILPEDRVGQLYDRLNSLLESYLGDTVLQFLSGALVGTPQDETKATHVCTRLPEDGLIDWKAPAKAVDALIRSLGKPFPGAFTYLGARKLTVWRSRVTCPAVPYEGIVPGRVVRIAPSGSIDVLCGDGTLTLLEVQLEADRPVVPNTLIRSVKTTLGDGVAARLARLEELIERIHESGKR